MPEGHVIHRLADELNDRFGGRQVQVSSPQGRFEASAAQVNGSTLVCAEAWGKHLFVEFGAPVPEPVIHIHLGLIGKMRVEPLNPPVGQVRLRISDGRFVADLRGPQTCALVGPGRREEVVAKLGPDPIREDADPERGFARINRSTKSIATLLMDQKVAAGVGNIFRAEVLFRHGVDPSTPGKRIAHQQWEAIWADLVAMMRQATDDGRIDSVLPERMPDAMGRGPRVDPHGGEVYVYRRAGQPCLVCGDEIRSEIVESRNLYWCPTCQRRH